MTPQTNKMLLVFTLVAFVLLAVTDAAKLISSQHSKIVGKTFLKGQGTLSIVNERQLLLMS